ncbi:hypothetical protein JOB18_000094 [Solea senegalensis]|uniref:Uncharacterized protein n=1 Tax=Solea senegalensis TaxID=28829 RepID=A0AAV6S3I8_SOLSE|nr:hypothetical protein JOB18_000094 [Solea senegalensis]
MAPSRVAWQTGPPSILLSQASRWAGHACATVDIHQATAAHVWKPSSPYLLQIDGSRCQQRSERVIYRWPSGEAVCGPEIPAVSLDHSQTSLTPTRCCQQTKKLV